MGAKIYRSDLTSEIIEGARIAVASDPVPNELAEKVVPVMEVNPKFFRRVNYIVQNNKTTTGSTGIATTSATKETFITSVWIDNLKSVDCDGTIAFCSGIVNGVSVKFIELRNPALVLGGYNGSINFNPPIKLDKGTAITSTQSFTAGSSNISVGLFGYEVDP